jgi:hypothetical protein
LPRLSVFTILLAILLAGLIWTPAWAAPPAQIDTPTVPAETATAAPSDTPATILPPTATDTPAATSTRAPSVTPSATLQPSPTPSATGWPTEIPSPIPSATVTPAPTIIYVTVEAPVVPTPDPRRPLIFIRSYATDPSTVSAGTDFYLTLELHNVGEREARNIVVTFASGTFVPIGTSSAKTVDKLSEDEHGMVGQVLRSNKDTASGVYNQSISLSYADEDGTSYSSTESVGVIVVGPGTGQPQLVVSRSATEPDNLAPDAEFELKLTVQNLGDRLARNVLVSLTPGGPFAPTSTGNTAPIASLARNAEAQVALRLVVDKSAKPGAYSQGVSLEFEDSSGTKYTSSQSIGLIVGARRIDQPLPLIVGYTAGVAELTPGGVFTLNLDIENVGARRAERVLLSIGTTSGGAASSSLEVIAPLGSSNLKFIPMLEPGARQTISQPMAVDGSAASGAYVLNVTLTYDDEDGNSYDSSEVISLLVLRPALLTVSLLEQPPELVVGEETPLAVDVTNVGRYSVNVTTADVSSPDFEVRQGSLYVGPLDAGTTSTLDAQIVPRRPGTLTLRAIVRYIDDFNRPQQFVKDFTFTAEPAPTPVPASELPKAGEEGGLLGGVLRFIRMLLGLGG